MTKNRKNNLPNPDNNHEVVPKEGLKAFLRHGLFQHRKPAAAPELYRFLDVGKEYLRNIQPGFINTEETSLSHGFARLVDKTRTPETPTLDNKPKMR